MRDVLLLVAFALLLIANPKHASGQGGGGGISPIGGNGNPEEPFIEFELRLGIDERLTVLGNDMFGDEIDPHTGSIAFSQTDISIPGNSHLPVALTRTIRQGPEYKHDNAEFGDWEYAVPRLKVVSAESQPWSGNVCSESFDDQFDTISLTDGSTWVTVANFVYNNGIFLEHDGNMEPLLEGTFASAWPSSADYVTNNFWYFTCQGGGGSEHFLGHAPNGDTYRFDRMIQRDAVDMDVSNVGTITRDTYILAATEVTDVHGNWVRYQYDLAGRLENISSNDGRLISLTYSGTSNLVSSVSANGRTWTYAYRPSTAGGTWSPTGGNVLEKVTLPDGREWEFTLDGMRDAAPPRNHCIGQYDLALSHPSGAQAEFDVWVTSHRSEFDNRSQVSTYACPTGQYGSLSSLVAVNTWSVRQKRIFGAGIPTAEWNFSYEEDRSSGENAGDRTNWTKVDGPTDHITYYHKWMQEPEGGAQTRMEIRADAGGAPLRTVDTTYVTEPPHGLPLSRDPFVGHLDYSKAPKRVVSSVLTQGGETYTATFAYNLDQNASGYSYGLQTLREASSTLGNGTRSTQITYDHKKTEWILGLPLAETTNGKALSQFTYDSKGQMLTFSRVGELKATMGYDSQGLLTSFKDGIDRETVVNGYYRGLPTSITRPDLVLLTRTVDDNGWITSQTDGNNVTTGFGYNSMGWLTLIDRVSPWSDTVISYSGLGAGVVQTSTRGNARTVTTYDRYHRPISTAMTDLSGAAPTVYNTFQYDGVGRTVFASLPSESASPAAGIASAFDGLGRVLSETHTGDGTVTSYSYGAKNSVSVSDPENNTTITEFSGFGSPDDGNPVNIVQPEGVTTTMTYDIWGNLTMATQGGVTQTWNYNNELELCRHFTPETNSTVMRYDAAGQITWRAQGIAGVSGCGSAVNSLRTKYTYDDMGRVTLINHPAGTADVTMQYDGNGNMLSNTRGGAAWAYTYNTANQLDSETLAIDGRTYAISYGYNNHGALNSEITPAGASLTYKPNGFGQPGRVRLNGSMNVAAAAGYHPNGALEELRYFNGQRYLTTLDARQMLASERWQKNSVSLTEFGYGRDDNGRITQITDYAVPGQDKTFTYDDLGRLIGANGPWGTGSYDYDAVNNIIERVVGSDAVYMNYDIDNRLSTVTTLPAQGLGQCGVAGTYTYDPRGNVTSNGELCFTYDAANQPVTMSGAATGSFTYDGNFKRVKQTIDAETIYSVYNLAGQMVFRDNITSGEMTDYFRLGGRTVARSDGTDITWLHHDHLGSPVAASDLNGAEKWREVYLPYGDTWMSAAANDNDMSFTGHIEDTATGLTYMQARYYDPMIGRFLSNDPMGFADMGGDPSFMNRYTYTFNDPVNLIDPDGQNPAAGAATGCALTGPYCPGGAIVGAAVGTVLLVAAIVVANDNMNDAGRGGDGRPLSTNDNGGPPLNEPPSNPLLTGPALAAELARRIVESDRSGSGQKPDSVHRAASFPTEQQLSQGQTFKIEGGDGITRELLQVEGRVNGRDGIFEYILDPDPTKGVTHQRFIPGGSITGEPNQRVP